MAEYENRQNWDLNAWPEMYGTLKQLQAQIFLSPPGLELNLMVFTVSSLAAGCRHCQAHGAYGANKAGVETTKVQALWSFETSDLFDERERAALRFGLAAGAVPSLVTAEHHAALREHLSDEEARTLIGVVALGGFMNRYTTHSPPSPIRSRSIGLGSTCHRWAGTSANTSAPPTNSAAVLRGAEPNRSLLPRTTGTIDPPPWRSLVSAVDF